MTKTKEKLLYKLTVVLVVEAAYLAVSGTAAAAAILLLWR